MTIKLCKDCKWVKRSPTENVLYDLAECMAPQNLRTYTDLVSGAPKNDPLYSMCCAHRHTVTEGCTNTGRWFEAAE